LAAIVGQPRNSIIMCRVQLGQDTSQLCQRTGIDNVKHRLWLSTGTQVRVDLSPSLPAGTAMKGIQSNDHQLTSTLAPRSPTHLNTGPKITNSCQQ